jgi:hypothetical protein
MGKVAGRGRRDAMSAVEAIGSAGADPESFARLGVAELPRLVASEITTLSVCDLKTGRRRVVGNPGHRLSPADIAAFDRHFFEHPLVRYHSAHHQGGSHRISDSANAREFRGSALFNESIIGASYRTVQKHLEHIYVKLGVKNRTAAAMRALRADAGNSSISLAEAGCRTGH